MRGVDHCTHCDRQDIGPHFFGVGRMRDSVCRECSYLITCVRGDAGIADLGSTCFSRTCVFERVSGCDVGRAEQLICRVRRFHIYAHGSRGVTRNLLAFAAKLQLGDAGLAAIVDRILSLDESVVRVWTLFCKTMYADLDGIRPNWHLFDALRDRVFSTHIHELALNFIGVRVARRHSCPGVSIALRWIRQTCGAGDDVSDSPRRRIAR